MGALSGMVSGRATPAAQERYADAVNRLTLVAPPAVLKAVYAFQDEISYRNTHKSDKAHDRLLSVVIHAMRNDVQPRKMADREPAPFRLLDVPPPTAYQQKRQD
ncbi:hypothetical protein [Paraburkholderia sp. J63]|uniref:hypothetical protein n=1 Tax=Paraburkholderia sp. J63 TaxID=2805434 RepID=UPI002ABD16D2|nr:hypothetical protein [Paraburkholderia sp. J63]